MANKTKTQKHTPGPWTHAEAYDNGEPVCIRIDSGAQTVAEVVFDSLHNDEIDANARLIAAAPDLLKAAKDLLSLKEIKDCLSGRWSTADPINYNRAEQLRAAIAKAEDRS